MPEKRNVPPLSEGAKAARAAYYRAWRRQNPEAAARNRAAYWERRASREVDNSASAEVNGND